LFECVSTINYFKNSIFVLLIVKDITKKRKNMTIENNHVVAVKYILHTIEEDGTKILVEETTEENPLTFLFGLGRMIPKFEQNIVGLKAGDKADFVIQPEEAYGEKDPNSITQLPIDMFQESGIPPVGAILPLSDGQGNNFQAFVIEVTPEAVIADLNHPMAGKVLDFQVEILNTRPATEEELSHGHAHGVDGTDAH
jgi:FKBP-type peptidyl-prolyl cis-trans isomerase SlyD